MPKKFACIALISFMLMLMPLGYAMETVDSLQGAIFTYEQALARFNNGKEAYLEACALFESIPFYLESPLYVCYLHSIQALEADDLDFALAGFRLQKKANFLDSDILYRYVCARRAERSGNYHPALLFYDGLDVYDSQQRLSSLRQIVYGSNCPDAEVPPIHAKKGGYAVTLASDVDVLDALEDGKPFARLPFAETVRINSFAYDSNGALFAQITVAAKSSHSIQSLREAKNGYVRAHFLYFLSEEETLEAGLSVSNPLTRGDVTWTGSIIKQNAPLFDSMEKGKAIKTVQPGDIVLIVDQIIGDKEYYQVALMDATDGYILTEYVAENPTPNIEAPTPAVQTSDQALKEMPDDPQSEEELFDFALLLMLNGSVENYQRAMLLFSKAEHESAAFYMLYANFLRLIERGEFEKARQALSDFNDIGYFDCRKANEYRGVLANEPIRIPEPGMMLDYLNARELESQEQFEAAYALYEGLRGYLDSPQRGASIGATIADSLSIPAADVPSVAMGIESALSRDPLTPLSVTLMSSESNSDQEQLYAFRESVMKRMDAAGSVGHPFLSPAMDAISLDPAEMQKLIVTKFSEKLFESFEGHHIFDRKATYFKDIAIQKIISVDLSSDMKRWNVCALMKMMDPKSNEIVYLPIQMSESGRLSSSYFMDAVDSIESFLKIYPSLLPGEAAESF